MTDVGWQFPLLLISAFLLSMAFTLLQQRAYNRELNKALQYGDGDQLMLISGRGRSFKGGAIVVMIVDTNTDQVVLASALSGFTVFARFKPAAQLLGPITGVADRVRRKPVKEAVNMAVAQLGPDYQPPSKPKASKNRSTTKRRVIRTKPLQARS